MSERAINTVNSDKFKLPELLAPAGGRQQLVAAINNGADAVYMGGSLFNARMKAENFSSESCEKNNAAVSEMKWAIDHAHCWNVKVYITLNTLIKESELPKAFEYACNLYEMGADALILQDMGLARLVHRYMPDFNMHLSTQGTVYNSSGVEMASQMGFVRVVPARECSIEDIKTMCGISNPDSDCRSMEIEVFVHGALCMGYSGQCQMSRLLGGGSARSGNRGLCAQPCRLQYEDDKGNLSYALSPKDLCTLEHLPQLCEAGVDSFKIEGRLKSPEYVAVVTGIYRKYMDIYAKSTQQDRIAFAEKPETWSRILDDEDRLKLLKIFNRGGFTDGYIEGNPETDILSGRSPRNEGVAIGNVISVRNVKGKTSAGRKLIDVKLKSGVEVVMGDGIELSETGNVVTYLEKLDDGNIRIGDFKTAKGTAIKTGEVVRRVNDKKLGMDALLTEASKRTAIDMVFTGHVGKPAKLTASCDGQSITVSGDRPIEKANRKPSDPERIKEQLSKLKGTSFKAGRIEIEVDKDAMIPVSTVNSLRRQAVDIALGSRIKIGRTPGKSTILNGMEDIKKTRAEEIKYRRNMKRQQIRLLPLELFMERQKKAVEDSEVLIPYILNVSKGNLDIYIKRNFNDIADAVADCGIAVGNLGWIREFQRVGVKVYGDYGLNVCNSQARAAFAEVGVEVIEISDEMSERRCIREPEFMKRIPLMITEHPFDSRYLVDRKGVRHDVIRWYSGDKWLLF